MELRAEMNDREYNLKPIFKGKTHSKPIKIKIRHKTDSR